MSNPDVNATTVAIMAPTFKAQLERLKDHGQVLTVDRHVTGRVHAIGPDYVVLRTWVEPSGSGTAAYEIDHYVPFSAIVSVTVRTDV